MGWHIPSGTAFFNDIYYEMLGYENGEFPSNYATWRTLVHEDDIERVEKELRVAVENGKGFNIDLRMRMKSGDWKWVSTRGKVVERDEKGTAQRMVGVLTDITGRKRAEEEINTKNALLQKLNSEKDKFISIIAHDLKSPFNSLIGFSKLLSENIEDFDKEEIRKFAKLIHDTSENTYKLLENLLEWSLSQKGSIRFQPEIIDLNRKLLDNIEQFRSIADRKKIKIIFEPKFDCLVKCDLNMINTILRNLLSNAVKYSYQNGQITVSVDTADNHYEVSIEDNGVGIKKEDLPKLFRIDCDINTIGTGSENGTGLGLILCKEFVEKHGCTIRTESEPGKGSKFIFTLPGA